ncbi:MAG: AAA family ATPase [bacterium]|nr:AAA family ATPase [bacterium]
MRLHRIGYSNFGPFKGDQAIELPDRDGVAVIYGDNNLGKTTILNSVRWLFSGSFPERTGRSRDPRELINREAVAEADGEPVVGQVTAAVTWRDANYTLTRSLILEGDRLKQRLDVIRGSDALGWEEAQATLQQMIPEEIQQFFLFDAEALNRYEDLLHDPTAGEELKKAIERILGVPVLKNAIQDLRALTWKHNKVISKLKTKSALAKSAANSFALLSAVLDRRDEDIASIKARIKELEDERSEIEQQMAASEKARVLITNHQQVAKDHEVAKKALEAARSRFKEVAPQTWTAVLTPTITTELDKLYAERQNLELEQDAFDRRQLLIQLREELAETGECPCCGQLANHPPTEDTHSAHDQSSKLSALESRIDSLERILDPAAVARLDERNKALQDAAVKVHDLATDLADAKDQIDGLDVPSLADLPTKLANTKIQLTNTRETLRDTVKLRDEDSEKANRLAAVIAEGGGEEGVAATKKQRVLTNLQSMYSAAIGNYREELKQRVEEEATAVFLSIRSDPDFTRLSINEDYGLSIVHKDGNVEPQRSAGYEHIVALSLVAALQKCAPIQAPIFMDMPFARLDPQHKVSTLKALPNIAAQVVVIVHKGEIDTLEARNTLKSALICERQLARRSARHTDILKIGSPLDAQDNRSPNTR